MPHSNVAIYLPNVGCRHNCSFCDQRIISGAARSPSVEEAEAFLRGVIPSLKNPQDTEIAFFGGTFTSLERTYMLSLLETARQFTDEYGLKGIRISTRPDYIGNEILSMISSYRVTAVELGAQSMCDHVLFANKRGHEAEDVRHAARLIKLHGFELGIQMMVGLYQSDFLDEINTASEIVALKPDTVRIYPTVILEGTRLAELFRMGLYELPSFESVVSLCADLLQIFTEANIKVIRLGLHSSPEMEKSVIGGFYHPAFRELCESVFFRRLIENETTGKGTYEVTVNPRDISKAVGHRRSNIKYFSEMEKKLKFIQDAGQTANTIKIFKTADLQERQDN